MNRGTNLVVINYKPVCNSVYTNLRLHDSVILVLVCLNKLFYQTF